jgi:hypothetical protein
VHREKPTLLAITQQNHSQTICFLKQRVMILLGPTVSLGDKIKIKKNNSIKVNYLILCSVCFDVKYFSENVFGIFWCLVGAKIMVNRNHFLFNRKSLFNLRKTIYGFQNRKSFSGFKLFILALL